MKNERRKSGLTDRLGLKESGLEDLYKGCSAYVLPHDAKQKGSEGLQYEHPLSGEATNHIGWSEISQPKRGDLRRNADLSLEIKGNVETILETDVLKLRSCIQTSLKIYLHSYRHNLSLNNPTRTQFRPIQSVKTATSVLCPTLTAELPASNTV